jgi:hypothetical protein
MKFFTLLAVTGALSFGGLVTNGSFEPPPTSTGCSAPNSNVNPAGSDGCISNYGGGVALYATSAVSGWATTDIGIEIWRNGQTYVGLSAYQGSQWAEINANAAGTLSTTITPLAGSTLTLSFAHSGRLGQDTANVKVTDGATVLLDKNVTDGVGWQLYSYVLPTPASGRQLTIAFTAVSSTPPGAGVGGSLLSFGNFLDAVDVTAIAADTSTPEPSSLGLTALALVGAAFARRRYRA